MRSGDRWRSRRMARAAARLSRAFVNSHCREIAVITSGSGRNPHPSRLVSGAGFGCGTAGRGKSTQQRSYRRVKSGLLCVRGVDETYRYFGPGLLPQSGGLSVGLPGAHAGPRIHPFDRRGPLQRRLHDQLGIECVSGHPRTHLRSTLRAGLPARARREGAGRDLPAQARCRRLQGRHPPPAAQAAQKEERQACRARRRRPRLARGGARPGADGLHLRRVRPGSAIRRHDADANSEIPSAGKRPR